MPEDQVELRGNSSSLEQAIDRAVKAFIRYDGNIDKIIKTSGKMDATGKKLRGSIEALTKAGERVYIAYTKVGSQFTIVGKEVEDLRAKTILNAAAQARIAVAEQQRLTALANARRVKTNANIALIEQETRKLIDLNAQRERTARTAIAKITTEGRIEAGTGKAKIQQETEAQKALNREKLEALRLDRARVVAQSKLDQINLRSAISQTNAANKAAQGLLLSWRSITRLLTIQLGYTTIFKITELFREGVSQAVEFQRAIAGVQTISQRSGLTFDELANGLQRVSDGWRLDILEQTEAAYQAITNQVVNGREAFAFLESANRFATAAFVETNEAVRLVTAAINAYGGTAEDAERIFGSFFKTIELGRVRGAELTEAGRILLPARTLGVELDEVNAAIATLTKQGVKANEAMTFLRNIFQAMIKPSDDMKEFLKSIGVETAQSAIETYGYIGFMQQLEDRFKGSSQELGKLFRRIRALGGIFGQQGRALNDLKANYDKITEGADSYNRAVDIVRSTSGEKLEIALSKVRNVFIRLGSDFLDTSSDLTNGFKYVSEIGRSLVRFIRSAAIPAMVGLITVTVELGAAFLATPWGAVIGGATALTAAISYLTNAQDRALQSARDLATEEINLYNEAATERLQARNEADRKVENLRKEEFRALQRQISNTITAYNKLEDERVASAVASNASILKMSDKVLESVRNNIDASEDQLRKIEDGLKRLVEGFRNLDPASNTTLFNWQLEEKTGTEALEFIQKRIATFRRQAKEAAARGDVDIFESMEKEILSLNDLYKNTYEKIVQENTKATDARIKLLNKAEEEDKKYAESLIKLQQKVAESSNERERRDAQAAINRLQNEYRETVDAIAEASARITSTTLAEVSHVQNLKTELESLRILRTQMAIQAEQEADKEREKIARQKLLEERVESIVESLRGFDIQDVFNQDLDAEALTTVIDAQQRRLQALQDIVKEEGLAVDLTTIQANQAEIRLAAETRLQKLQTVGIKNRLSAAEAERKAILELAEKDRVATAQRIQNVKEAAIQIAAALQSEALSFPGIDPTKDVKLVFSYATDRGIDLETAIQELRDADPQRVARQAALDYVEALKSLDPTDINGLRLLLETSDQLTSVSGKIANQFKNLGLTDEYAALNTLLKEINTAVDNPPLLDEVRKLSDLQETIKNLKADSLTTDKDITAEVQSQVNLLERALKLQAELRTLTAPQPAPIQRVAPSASGASTTIGDININVTPSGDLNYDVKQLATELQRGVKQGRFQLA